MKKSLALLLVFALALSCFPLGAVTAFAAENEETQPPSEPAGTTPTEVPETQPARIQAEAPEISSLHSINFLLLMEMEKAPPDESISATHQGALSGMAYGFGSPQ